MKPTFGVAITTLNRRQQAVQTINEWKRYTPSDVPIFVVDDGSDVPFPDADHRNSTPQGVAAAKNASIALLMDAGCEYLFLADDDCHPDSDRWWELYIQSGYPHLLHQPREQRICQLCHTPQTHIYNTLKGCFDCTNCSTAVRPAWEDDAFFAPQWAAGVLYYMTRDTIDKVGGLRTEFGRWSSETWEYSYRIRNVLKTPYPFIAPKVDSIHAVDAYTTGKRSSVSQQIRNEHSERNWKLFLRYRGSTDFVPYRTEPDLNATVCFPWRSTPTRGAAHARCFKYWVDHGFRVVEGDSDPELPFLCGKARNNAVKQADTDVVIVADADTIPDDIKQIHDAIDMVTHSHADMCYPFTEFRHIDGGWATKDYTQAPAQQVYFDSPGGIFILRRDVFDKFGGFDERFTPGQGGYDDTAFRLVCETLGTVARITGVAWSFNHATRSDGKPDRDFSEANRNLPRFRLYEFARGKPDLMRELIK